MAKLKPYSCHICHKSFRTSEGAAAHTIDVHHFQCPQCPMRFESTLARARHQQAERHFKCARCHLSSCDYAAQPTVEPISPVNRQPPVARGPLNSRVCKLCNKQFLSESALANHQRDAHTMTFRCCPCNRDFLNEAALRQHLRDKKHCKTERKSSSDCEECKKSFQSQAALRQHRESTVHKPLASLRCLGNACRLTFNSPSALLHHLESGSCSSGWTRHKVNSILHRYDKDRILTTNIVSLDTMFSSMTGSPSISSVSDLAILTPDEWSGDDDDDDGGGNELPSGAMMSSPVGQSFPVAIESPAYLPNLFCPLCLAAGKKRVFKDLNALTAHVSSAAHAEKAFRCPVVFAGDKNKASDSVQPKLFNTLSGLTQHLESGQCRGGKYTLWRALDYLWRDILQLEWPGKLLQN